jgi:cytochrome b pre-mRNA-processing protein 3
MGVGDLSVPKEMRRMGEAFYGRTRAYRAALAAQGEEPLIEAAMACNVYGGEPALSAAPARLAAYMREAVRQIGDHQSAKLLAGDLRFPDPDSIVLVEDKDHLSED